MCKIKVVEKHCKVLNDSHNVHSNSDQLQHQTSAVVLITAVGRRNDSTSLLLDAFLALVNH